MRILRPALAAALALVPSACSRSARHPVIATFDAAVATVRDAAPEAAATSPDAALDTASMPDATDAAPERTAPAAAAPPRALPGPPRGRRCPRERVAGDAREAFDLEGQPECARDADCRAGANGRCVYDRRWPHGENRCTYDECFSDGDCAAGTRCECRAPGGVEANVCVPADCRTDADCGGRRCAPSLTERCPNFRTLAGYYCRTARDECSGSCSDGQYCVYVRAEQRWACRHGGCRH